MLSNRGPVFLSGSPAMNVYTFKRTGTLIEKEKKKNTNNKAEGKEVFEFYKLLFFKGNELVVWIRY
jgi:hypothetical protein